MTHTIFILSTFSIFSTHELHELNEIYMFHGSSQIYKAKGIIMSELKLPTTTRRQILKYFASAPLLPMAVGGASASMLVGCSGDDDSANAVPAASFKAAVFSSMAAPTLANPAEMATTLVKSTLEVTLSDDSKLPYLLAYQPFFKTGDMVPDGKGGTILAGGYVDINNKPIIDKSVAGKERQFFSDSPMAHRYCQYQIQL